MTKQEPKYYLKKLQIIVLFKKEYVYLQIEIKHEY